MGVKGPSYAMTADGNRGARAAWPLGVLAGCALAVAAAAAPAAAQRPPPNPEVLWRAYPLEQPPPPRASERGPRHTRQAEAPRENSPRRIVVMGVVGVGVLLAGGGLALLWRRTWRPAPALRAPLPTARGADAPPSRSAPQGGPGPPATERCWIVCWRGTGRAVFYAVARDSEGRQQFIGESPAFTATTNTPLVLDGAAFEALQSLATRLSHGGWEAAAPVGDRGAMWHAQEFRRKNVAAELRR